MKSNPPSRSLHNCLKDVNVCRFTINEAPSHNGCLVSYRLLRVFDTFKDCNFSCYEALKPCPSLMAIFSRGQVLPRKGCAPGELLGQATASDQVML